jgi:hypothetical protein
MNDVAQELRATLKIVDRLQQISEETAAHKPQPATWSRKEILGHLLDSAANNLQRFVRMQLQDHLELPGYDQDGWVRIQRYQELEWGEILQMWEMYNRHLARLIATANPDALKHTWKSPDGEIVNLEFVMRDYIVHMKHHLDQIL